MPDFGVKAHAMARAFMVAGAIVLSAALGNAQGIVREPAWSIRAVGVVAAPDAPVVLEDASYDRGTRSVLARATVPSMAWMREHRITLRFGSVLDDTAMLTFRLRQRSLPLPSLPSANGRVIAAGPIRFRPVEGDPLPGYYAVGYKTLAAVTIEEITDSRGTIVYENPAAAEQLWAALMTKR
jgi:hypothetical protein